MGRLVLTDLDLPIETQGPDQQDANQAGALTQFRRSFDDLDLQIRRQDLDQVLGVQMESKDHLRSGVDESGCFDSVHFPVAPLI